MSPCTRTVRLLLPALALSLLVCATSPSQAGLTYTLGETGLASLQIDDQSLLTSPHSGGIRAVADTPKIKGPDGAITSPREEPKTAADQLRQSIRQEYAWGVITCTYAREGDVLRLALEVTNTSPQDSIEALELELANLTFPQVPDGKVLDTGMFGMGGKWTPLHANPLSTPSNRMPPVIFLSFGTGTLAFANDGPPGAADDVTIAVPFSTDPDSKRAYPFRIRLPVIGAGKTVTAAVSLRFGSADASAQTLAGDVLRRFRETYPLKVQWVDRRAIGALFLATSERHPETNPRGWFGNAKDVDTTTPEGLAKWRERLMRYADAAIKVMKEIDAQGMVTWDIEGEQFRSGTYYGDPRLASRLAPETDLPGETAIGALDEYFQKFAAAGFRTGVTLRPQAIVFKDGAPFQEHIDNPTQELLDKIDYARKRWGCTLFYIDSTYDKIGALPPEVFETVGRMHPDVLVLPENESFRYFAYSAPLNSFAHHDVTGTPMNVREVYPDAFSVLIATAGADKFKAHELELVESVRRGDILLVAGWFTGVHTEYVKRIYQQARQARDVK